MRLRIGLFVAYNLMAGSYAQAQEVAPLVEARRAYTELDYSTAIAAGRRALQEPLDPESRAEVYELLGYAYGALDSTRQAVTAFQQLIFLEPDREPDVERVSPRITSLYASALGQVLVVRRVRLDSVTFVAGLDSAAIRFEVSRTAETSARVIGSGVDLIVDSNTVTGPARADWPVTYPDGRPLPEGIYEIVVTAREGTRGEYASRPLRVRVSHGRLDTLPHLTALAGYQKQPELVTPPRDWRPLALSILYAGVVAGAFFALDDGAVGTGPRTALASVGGATVAGGIVLSLRRPEPRPSPTNILYNSLLRDLIARRNADIARENEERRARILLTVVAER